MKCDVESLPVLCVCFPVTNLDFFLTADCIALTAHRHRTECR